MAGPVEVTGVVGFVVGTDVTVAVGVVGTDPPAACVGVTTGEVTRVTVPVLLTVLFLVLAW